MGGINLIPVWAPASRPIKRIAVECTAAASADALIELGFYDPVSLDLIVSMGTVNLATSTGGKVAQIGTAVLLPPLALLAVRLRSASLSGGKWRAGTVLPGPAAALMPGGNPWDSVGGGYMGWRIARAGTDALPAALPTTEWDVAAFNDGPVPFATLIPV